MSFNIGPFIGKRDAVIKAVNDYQGSGDSSQLEAARALILAELNHVPDSFSVIVQAWGHHDAQSGHRNLVLTVNQVVGVIGTTPQHVE
jgi:hypothetical protein